MPPATRRTTPARDVTLALVLALTVLAAGCDGALTPGAPAWTPVALQSVPSRWGHQALYDARRDRMVVYAGEDESGMQRGDIWALDLRTQQWSELTPAGGPVPSPRTDYAAVMDAARDRFVVIGGRVGLATSINEVWAFDLGARRWTQLPAGPPARHDVPAVTDGQRAWVFGGAGVLFQSLNDLWELDLATDTWRALPDDGVRPVARGSSAMAYAAGSVYVVEGHDVAVVRRDVWRYELAARRWTQVFPEGSSAAGAHFGWAFDPQCNALYLSGGDNLDNADVAFTDALVLGPTARFARVAASLLPPPRDHASMMFDPTRRQLVLFGGSSLGDGLGLRHDAWTFAPRGCP